MEDGATYKICSVKYRTVLDVPHSNYESGTKIITYTDANGENQAWKADIEANGFRLAAAGGKVLPEGMTVLDDGVDDCTVTIYQFHGGDNQKWTFTRVDGDAYLLENSATKRFLTATGCFGEVVTACLTGECDQHWILERIC